MSKTQRKVWTIWEANENPTCGHTGDTMAHFVGAAYSKAAAQGWVEERMEAWEKNGEAKRVEHGGKGDTKGTVWITQAVVYRTLPQLPIIRATYIVREEDATEVED